MMQFSKTILISIIAFFTMQSQAFTQNDNSRNVNTNTWKAENVLDEETIKKHDISFYFKAYPISDDIYNRIWLKSYKKNCTIPRNSLRYITLLHINKDGKTQTGEMICNQSIANDLLQIFQTLYENKYKIERVVLVDNYQADDEASMRANNTSCFNFRQVAGSTMLSKHSKGLAIDINPLINPCVNTRTGKIEPSTGKPYAYNRQNKSQNAIQMITTNDLCYKLFIQHGFKWGGSWKTKKDYQHFEK
ncbi:MAG: M15 family metallopeptidase [Prevotellaceae bacterium]|nr:M15 family metallopeptidase [Candidatus Minthosoma caballi]